MFNLLLMLVMNYLGFMEEDGLGLRKFAATLVKQSLRLGRSYLENLDRFQMLFCLATGLLLNQNSGQFLQRHHQKENHRLLETVFIFAENGASCATRLWQHTATNASAAARGRKMGRRFTSITSSHDLRIGTYSLSSLTFKSCVTLVISESQTLIQPIGASAWTQKT